eukprot:TRINITY_DN7471_c0_g1_i1.p1 TRINITY_DN7471_c0_g1~~TRINITY_DN7471_c0_g1_i1.p1  ORF type:complete len:358 (-),score=85.17 TRINITY_DN7471_c0_g1_i1:176-1249(-)
MEEKSLLSIAPMMEYTTVPYRFLVRLLSKKTRIYTEMYVASTVIHNPKRDVVDTWLTVRPEETPITIQLGGSIVEELKQVIPMCHQFDEINLNCGCPSGKVLFGGFGASLMLSPELVRDVCIGMREVTDSPITVKCRLGVDDVDSYEELKNFISTVAESGVTHFIVHARKCWLNGISPKKNRHVPVLKYDWVYNLAKDFPHLKFSLNGGVETLSQVKELLARDGGAMQEIMVGRAAFRDPYNMLADADRTIFGCENPGLSRREVLMAYADYCEERMAEGIIPDYQLLNPIQHLFSGCRCSSKYRTVIMNAPYRRTMTIRQMIELAMTKVEEEDLDFKPPTLAEKSMEKSMEELKVEE